MSPDPDWNYPTPYIVKAVRAAWEVSVMEWRWEGRGERKGNNLAEGEEDGGDEGTEGKGVIAEAEDVAAGKRDAAEGVGALAVKGVGDLVGGSAEVLLEVGEVAVEGVLRVARLQRRVDPSLRIEALLPELPHIHHHHLPPFLFLSAAPTHAAKPRSLSPLSLSLI